MAVLAAPDEARNGTAASGADVVPMPPPRVSMWATLLLSGGGHPRTNAVAHERNVVFAQRALLSLGLPLGRRSVLFADGDSDALDLQLEEPDPARHRRLYALGLYRGVENARDAVLRYRNHDVGPSQRADLDGVKRALRKDAEAATSTAEAPPLLMYVTDHGLEAKDRSNNTILLWDDEKLSVRELGVALDRQPPGRRVVTVMAQCFSGSFASLVHQGGHPDRPLAPHDRCGFFAAPRDRPAAGCSPRSDEGLYDDYTTRFFAALSGTTRTGTAAAAADLDGDGAVSLEEAHFAAVLLEDTMDVPVTTSEELLRRERGRWLSALDRRGTRITSLLAAGRPMLQRVGNALHHRLALSPDTTLGDLDDALDEGESGCFPGFCEAVARAGELRRQVHEGLRRGATFPPPEARPNLTLGTLGSAAVDAWIARAAPDFEELLRVEASVDRLRAQSESLEGRRLRLVRLVELVWLERALRGERDPLVHDYDRIRACEGARLDQPRAASGQELDPR